MKKPALNKWLDQLSEQLLNSTEIVNNLGQQKQQEEGTTGEFPISLSPSLFLALPALIRGF